MFLLFLWNELNTQEVEKRILEVSTAKKSG
jgi:hypothetical protein